MKKNYFLNKIWLKPRRDNSKLNFILPILKTHKNETMLFISYFSKMFMYVKRVNRYFIVFLMLVTSRSETFFKNRFLFDICIWYNEYWLNFYKRLSKLSILNVSLWYDMISICNINNKKKSSWYREFGECGPSGPDRPQKLEKETWV